MITAAEWFVNLLTVYAAIGIAFALLFAAAGAQRIDAAAKGAGIGFRIMILPGAAALWPILLPRWARGSS
jgi:hypothetical protein